VGGRAKEITLETSDLQFFSKENIPPLSVDRVNDLQIKKCFNHYSSPLLPTEFD
jgi:hypothetical protein